jgi:tetratricopeptide (TPR) repeat protein
MSLGEWAEVDALGSRIRALENTGVAGQRLLGTIYAGQQNFDQSIAAFEQAYQASPSDIQSMASLVAAYVADGRTDQAMEFLDSVLAQNEDNSNVRVLKGRLLQVMNRIEDAESEFSEAIRRQPTSVDAYANLSRINLEQGQMDDALEVLDAGLAELPDDFTLNIMKANLLEAQNDIEGAIAIYEVLIQIQPNSDLIANNLASLLSDYRDDEASYQRALELAIRFRSSVIPNFQDTLGWVYFRLGDAATALSLLEDAASAIPDFSVFRYHLGMAHKALGDNAAARIELEKALELAGDSAFPFRDEVEKAIMEL